MDAWELNLRIADGDFLREVLPATSWSLPAGEIVSVQLEGITDQGTTTSTAGVLDRDAGIDYIIRGPDGVSSVAARVSYWSSPAYLTFTLGDPELAKRRRELQSGQVMGPTFTVQGTVTCPQTGTFVCGAVVETADLIHFVDSYPGLVRTHTNTITGRPFHVAWVEDLDRQGYGVDVYIARDAGPIKWDPGRPLSV